MQREFTLYLIRHGQSEVNAQPDLIGQAANTQLTAHGRLQAERLMLALQERHLIFDKIFSSDYVRAMDTAKIATSFVGNPSPIICPELREYSAGDWAFGSRKEIITPTIQLQMSYLGSAFLPPNGESLHQVERRASKWLEDNILYNEYLKERHLNIGVFSHGMTIKCLLRY